jgi:hypothetical protein
MSHRGIGMVSKIGGNIYHRVSNHNALKSSGTSPNQPSRLRHIALNSSIERFQEFRRSGRAKPKPTTCTPCTSIFSNKSGTVVRSVSVAAISEGGMASKASSINWTAFASSSDKSVTLRPSGRTHIAHKTKLLRSRTVL